MGGCMSSGSDHSLHHKPFATVITVAGGVRRYHLPVVVSQVIQFETSSPDSVFLCNSDRLYFDDYIPRLDVQETLEANQIYFVLPISRLERPLAASDMAALALKASVALSDVNPRRSRKARISPVLVSEDDPQARHQIKSNRISPYMRSKTERKNSIEVARVSSIKKLHKYSSRRARLAVRSSRIKLTTINEGSLID